METFLVGLQGFAHGQSVYMFSSSGVKVIFCKTMCFALKRMQSYPQPGARKLCEDNTGSGRRQDWRCFTLAMLAVFHRMHLWESLKLRLKGEDVACGLQADGRKVVLLIACLNPSA